MKEPKSVNECSYFTKRTLTDENGKEVGKVQLWVFREEENVLYYKYVCPKCGYKGEGKMEWDWKFPVKIVCDRCNYVIKVKRLNPRARRRKKKNG